MRVRGTVVEYFKNYQGENSAPFYRSLKAYPTTTPQKLVVERPTDTNFYEIVSPRVTAPINSYRYTDEDAAADAGHAVTTIKVRVRGESALVGVGPYKEATFTL